MESGKYNSTLHFPLSTFHSPLSSVICTHRERTGLALRATLPQAFLPISFAYPMIRSVAVVLCIVASGFLFAQTTPVEGLRDKTPNVFALKNATVTVSPGKVIEKATVIIRDHHIVAVGSSVGIPADAIVIDATGQFIYAGFIDAFTNYGIATPQAAPNTSDDYPTPTIDRQGARSWNGAIHSELDATKMFKPDDKAAEKFRANGFTVVQTASFDGIFRGTSCMATLGGGTPNDHILPGATRQFMSFDKGSSKQDYPSSLMGSIALIRQTFYDAKWYRDAQAAYQANPALERPEHNDALEALIPSIDKTQTIVFDAGGVYNMLRVKAIADEFGLNVVLKGMGAGYKRLDAIAGLHLPIIVPVAFPEAPNVSTPEDEAQVSFADLKLWDQAPENPGRLEHAGVKFALTSFGLKDASAFLKNVRTAIKRGLSEQGALAALTVNPASICGVEKSAGTIEAGKAANLVICSAPIFDEKAKIYSVWIDGKSYNVSPAPEMEPRGTWELKVMQGDIARTMTLEIGGEQQSPEISVTSGTKKTKATGTDVTHRMVTFSINGDSIDMNGTLHFSGTVNNDKADGFGTREDGSRVYWSATRTAPYVTPPDTSTAKKDTASPMALFATTYPDVAFGFAKQPDQPKHVAITNAKIWTVSAKGIIDNATIVFGGGKIIAVGADVKAPSDAIVIDAAGKQVTPGVIDEHSHIAIDGEVNEGAQAVSAEVRIGDVIDPDDINIYRQTAGGTTITQCLHGSANPIGGQCQVIKHRWGLLPEEMKMTEATPTIKFALGENVKQSNWGDRFNARYPQSRMGVEQIMRDELQSASEYEHKWRGWIAHPSKNEIPPRRDLELDAIVEVLQGKRMVHCHSYVQSEILMLMRLAEDYHFHIGTFTHILEGYKLAPEMKAHGTMASGFSDWWDYKFEVFDAIPYNAAMLEQEGVVSSVNSDDPEMGRRLNQEAAKCIKYGGLTDTEAIKLCTLNPAKSLGIDNVVGSLEPGKDADIVLWSGNPLSAHSKPLQTWIDGRKYFDIDEDKKMQDEVRVERAALVARAAKAKGGSGHGENPGGKKQYDCVGGMN